MQKTVIAAFVLAVSLASSVLAAPDAIVVRGGDLRIRDAGSGLVFPDGSIQTKATVAGPTGATGPTGPAGPANHLAIGTVQAGTQAGATITGTVPNQTLNLILPQGPAGPPGPAAPLGVVCNLGEVYVQTADGIQCGRIKRVTNATGTCVGNSCFLACDDTWGNCDSENANGCETSFISDPLHCGGCNNICSPQHTCYNLQCVPTGKLVKGPVTEGRIYFERPYASAFTDPDGRFPIIYPDRKMTSSGGLFCRLATKGLQPAPDMKAPAGAMNITALTTVVADATDQTSANALVAAFQKLGIAYDAPLDTVNANGSNRSAMAINEIVGELINNNAVSAANLTSFLTALIAQIQVLPPSTNLSNPDNIVATVTTAAATVPAVNTALTTNVSGGTILANIVSTIKNIAPNSPLPNVNNCGTGSITITF